MPRVEVVPANTPFGERLAAGFGYPQRAEIDALRRQLASPA